MTERGGRRLAGSYLLGVDIGTYSSKGVLVSETGQVLAASVAEHSLSIPGPGRAEHDAEAVWFGDFCAICRELLSAADARRIAAIGISTISPAVVALDGSGAALRPAILYGIDTRATREIAEIEEATGVRLSSQAAAPKVLWIRRNEPEVWARTKRIVNGSGFLVLRLTGENTIDVYDAAGFSPFFEADPPRWSTELASLIAPVEMMPRPTWTHEVAGRVTAQAARETGLAAGTPVITGTADAAAEAISAGLTAVGDLMVMYGSSTFFILRTRELLQPRRFWGTRFLAPGTYVVTGGTATAGSLTRWFRDEIGHPETAVEKAGGANAYEALAALAASSPPGARGLVMLPYFSGERTPLNDPEAKGMVFGLSLSHSRADLYRALLESVGYSIRHNIEALAEEGCRPRRIFAVGGGTRNPLWMRIVSDIAGISQFIPEQQIGASYGDAFLAGLGVGLFAGLADAGNWVRLKEPVRPDLLTHVSYEGYYRLYRDLYDRNAESMRRLGALARGERAV